MTGMDEIDWPDVAEALLGSWPTQVAGWGRKGLAAYGSELRARGVSPEMALVAIRACPSSQAFPPSAPELAALARCDPGQPTAEEIEQIIFGQGGVTSARLAAGAEFANEAAMLSATDDARQARAWEVSPMVGAFVQTFGLGRLRRLQLEHPQFGHSQRKELREAWERFVISQAGRETHAIARGRRGELGRPDLLGSIPGAPHRQIGPA